WAVPALLAVVVAEGFRAHPGTIAGAGGVLLTWAHLLPAALWAGMLFYTVRAAVAWRADPAAVRCLVGLYAKAAAWLFALVVGTGVISALVLVPAGDLFTTGYGRVLVVKAALVAAAAALAVAGRVGRGRARATLAVAAAAGTVPTLTARGCGPGCLVAPVRWAHGHNLLTIRAAPDRYPGGTATLDIPWPPQPGDALLRQVTAALRAT